MRKSLSIILAILMLLTLTLSSATAQTTEVGTPREQTLIVECQSAASSTAGQFNPYMQGTQNGFGIHQLLWSHLWEMDTISGDQFGDLAESMPESNEDFTEHIVKLRQNIKWSDGEQFTADDVVFTVNMIMTNTDISQCAYYNTVFESVEKVDDFTVKFVTKESFPRLALKFGVTIWGNDLRIMPEHIYSTVENPAKFADNSPVVTGPYTVKEYDPLGTWILYQLREDWQFSDVGAITGKEPAAKYILFKYLGDDTTRQMSMISNQVDILCEVTPEALEVMTAANDKIRCWYEGYPYATFDDPCSKGLLFEMAKEPFDNKYFRWGIALAMNFDEISMNIFDGAGRASVLPILTATTAIQELYYKPIEQWLKDFTLELDDGTTFNPWDSEYKDRMAERLTGLGYDIPTDEAELEAMFGIGSWKYAPDVAEKLFVMAGLEKKADGWYFKGEPFSFELAYLAETEAQAGRGVLAAYDQLTKFGFNVSLSSSNSATWDTNGATGNFDIAGYWPTGGITKDIYSQINGWANDLIVPLGERGAGQGARWDNQAATDIIYELAKLSPSDDKAYELGIEFLKIAVEELPFIGFHSGTKYVPTNATYWENYPSADNAYNGPWWWWSCFKFIVPNITPVAK